MELGIYTFADMQPDKVSGKAVNAHRRIQQLLEEIQLADQVGLDVFAVGEHHRPDYAISAPAVVLGAAAAITKKIKLSSAVTVLSSDDPVRVFQSFATVDLISGGRLQLGISRGSPEQVIDGWRYFGYEPAPGETDADMARRKTLEFLDKLRGIGFAKPNPNPMFPNPPGLLRLEPHSEGLRDRIWWGAASNATAVWAAETGMNLQSSTLKYDESGKPFHIQQAEQIRWIRKHGIWVRFGKSDTS